MSKDPEQTIYGKSPLGGNSVEGTTDGCAAVRDSEIQGVPLFWDDRVKAYISEQAVEELDDRDLTLSRADDFNSEEEFRVKAGFTKDGTRS